MEPAAPGLVIAGASSSVGKTTITLAIIRSLIQKGLKVQSFKVGPDFIDPSYHEYASGRASRTLDPWLMGNRGVVECFAANSSGSDISIVEGVMGLYDGMYGDKDFASTAQISKLLRLPVILVLDASRSARSVAAVALGFKRFDPRVNISGLIINNVGSERHASFVRDAINSTIKIPILGIVKRFKRDQYSERHLGLIPIREMRTKRRRAVLSVARIVSEQLDVDAVIKVSEASALILPPVHPRASAQRRIKIAVALDESFNFYYADNLEILRQLGGELEFFSPVNDKVIPQGATGIILGGGFPEILANKLEKNQSMIGSLRDCISSQIPFYAECGGLMFLTKSISGYDQNRRRIRMVGAVDAHTVMNQSLTLGYTLANCNSGIFSNSTVKGHEFHYSSLEHVGKDSKFAYQMKRGKGAYLQQDGFLVANGIASYTHIHFAGNRKLAANFVRLCNRYSVK